MRRIGWTIAPLAGLAWTLGAMAAQETPRNSPDGPEVEACRATGLIAIKERDPAVKEVFLDPDGITVAKANTKIEDTPIRTIVMGDAYLEKTKTQKPYRFLCLIGEKGKVLLTFFTDK